jgi:hypothetical protein
VTCLHCPLSGNGSINTFPRQQIRTQQLTVLIAYFPILKKIECAYEITLLCVCAHVRVAVYPPIVARQRIGKSLLIVARQRLHFLCCPCRIKGKQAISCSLNIFFSVCFVLRLYTENIWARHSKSGDLFLQNTYSP